ncbi:MAG: sugar-binding protein, partial [Fibrobacter sp.]|nr:sugar-binding protein [Fibrobacter sp.]
MNAKIQKPIWKCLFVTLLLASFSFAGFSEYRDRDQSRFIMKPAKPFRPDKDVVTVVMREAVPRGGGYTYQYPRENPEPFMTDKYAKEGALSMEIELIASDYSGVAICIAGSVDLTPYLEEGVLEFWIKGAKGGENALFVLVDDGVKSGGESLQVKLRSKSLGEITTEWTHYS